ncbi:MAG: HK97 family phage prohead protease [Mogibacterium sp.]|nr:HK97 family phage prohead protease [Mogibacterium sp.]
MKNNKCYREADIKVVKRAEAEDGYFVEGYASTFKPYVLFSDDGVDYSEVIDRHAFDETDMSDVVFRIDHEGAVYARTSNGLIELSVDDIGLFNRIDLGQTEKAKELYRDIEVGNYPKMSFAFTVAEDEYDKKSHTRTIKKVGKLYDVSAVSFPANPDTRIDVSTRDYFNGVIEMERAERLREEEEREKKESLLARVKSLKGGE